MFNGYKWMHLKSVYTTTTQFMVIQIFYRQMRQQQATLTLVIYPLDNAIFSARDHTYTELCFYGHYRADCFVLWNGTYERFHDFYNFINALEKDLKFTMEISEVSSCFLDLKISIVNNEMDTTVTVNPLIATFIWNRFLVIIHHLLKEYKNELHDTYEGSVQQPKNMTKSQRSIWAT